MPWGTGLDRQLWAAAVSLSKEGRYTCPKGSALVFQRHKFVSFFLSHALQLTDAKWMMGGYLVVPGSC